MIVVGSGRYISMLEEEEEEENLSLMLDFTSGWFVVNSDKLPACSLTSSQEMINRL